MNKLQEQQKQVDDNFIFFKEWMKKGESKDNLGKFALIKDKEIKGFYSTWDDANNAGKLAYKASPFSIQKIEENAINLGYYSAYGLL